MVNYYNDNLPLIVTLWLLGVMVLLLRLLGQLAYVQRLKVYGVAQFPDSWQEKLAGIGTQTGFAPGRTILFVLSRRFSHGLWLVAPGGTFSGCAF
jgi:hypothetical protein